MIQTAFNGMLAILLAKFCLNDLPHAAGLTGPSYDRPPTTAQLRYIAGLRQRLKMTITYERQVVTFGEAGRMIRELLAEEKYRKKLESPSSPTFRVERTTVDKVIDDLKRTWHRIESDMSTRMQSSLSILKNIMGFYYEELAVVAWSNTDLVGIVVYKTAYDVDLQVQETRISELASFTHRPGVGWLLVGEVIKIAGEVGSDNVTAQHGPGAKGFYEKLGFVIDVQHPEIPTSMVYRLKGGNPGLGGNRVEYPKHFYRCPVCGQLFATSKWVKVRGHKELECPYCSAAIGLYAAYLTDRERDWHREHRTPIPDAGILNPNTAADTCNSDTWLYHATTYDIYHSQIKNYGIIPKPLTGDVATIVGFDSGIYLANSVDAAKDLAMLKYGKGEYVVLNVKLPAGTQLEVDPEIGEPDSPWFITPSVVPPGNVILLDVGGQAPTGTCYPDAWRFLIKQEEGELVHGEVTGADGITRRHAWIELPTGFIYEPQTARFYEHDVFKRAFSPVEAARYTVEEAAIMVARTGKHGPWSEGERDEWLRS